MQVGEEHGSRRDAARSELRRDVGPVRAVALGTDQREDQSQQARVVAALAGERAGEAGVDQVVALGRVMHPVGRHRARRMMVTELLDVGIALVQDHATITIDGAGEQDLDGDRSRSREDLLPGGRPLHGQRVGGDIERAKASAHEYEHRAEYQRRAECRVSQESATSFGTSRSCALAGCHGRGLRQTDALLQCMIAIVRHEHESFSTEPRELRAPARANEPQLAARAALAVGRAKRHACGGPPWRDAIGDEPEPRATPRVV